MPVRRGRIVGIPVRAHYTLRLMFLLMGWSLAYGYMPQQYPGLDGVTYWAIGITSALLLFVSVLIHELAHSYIFLGWFLRSGAEYSRSQTVISEALAGVRVET